MLDVQWGLRFHQERSCVRSMWWFQRWPNIATAPNIKKRQQEEIGWESPNNILDLGHMFQFSLLLDNSVRVLLRTKHLSILNNTKLREEMLTELAVWKLYLQILPTQQYIQRIQEFEPWQLQASNYYSKFAKNWTKTLLLDWPSFILSWPCRIWIGP